MMTDTDDVAQAIIDNATCGKSDCTDQPSWVLQAVRIETTDGGEVELAGYLDTPINRVCNRHKEDKNIAKLVINHAWLIVLRSIEYDNPGMLKEIDQEFKIKKAHVAWKTI